jgi:hypothetical protein
VKSSALRLGLLGLLLGCSAPLPLALSLDATVREGGSTVVACTPGLQATCMCPGNARGIRVCQDDMTYTPCLCVDARVPCFSGAVQGCDCGGGVAGIQFCGEDGVFTGCQCSSATTDAGETPDFGTPLLDVVPIPDAPVDRVDAGVDGGFVDVAPDRPEVCVCEQGAMRFCPVPPGQVEATYAFGPCRRGVQRCEGAACWGTCVGRVDPTPEMCNGVDDNCNGLVDDLTVSCGLGPCRRVVNTCVDGGVVPCMPDLTQRRDETCNGLDDNCNGMIDDMCRDF